MCCNCRILQHHITKQIAITVFSVSKCIANAYRSMMGIFKVSRETQMFFACETQKNWIKKPQTRNASFSKLKVT